MTLGNVPAPDGEPASATGSETDAPPLTTVQLFVRSFLTPQFLRYIFFSGLAALTNFIVGNMLYNLAGWDGTWSYKFAVTLGFGAGMLVSYILNRYFTFARSGRRLHREIRTFVIVSLGGLLLTVLIAASLRAYVTPALLGYLPDQGLLQTMAADPEATSHFIAIGLVLFYSFTSHRLFTFDRGISHHFGRIFR